MLTLSLGYKNHLPHPSLPSPSRTYTLSHHYHHRYSHQPSSLLSTFYFILVSFFFRIKIHIAYFFSTQNFHPIQYFRTASEQHLQGLISTVSSQIRLLPVRFQICILFNCELRMIRVFKFIGY